MTSMADHLRSQEYLRLRRSANSLLLEPRMSDEDAARLVEAYERTDTSDSEYLDLVTENRPFTPPQTTHSVVIDTGSYCSSTALPVILKSFLHDHGNAVVDNILSRHEVSVVEKIPSGGVLVHVRSADAEKKLVGQEVMILGRKFAIKRQLPFIDKFYLDISGIHSSEVANQLFMGLSAIGARPLFWTPRDVNMEAQVATPTWRFYFGQEIPPSCLRVRGFVTNQLAVGGHFYSARGKRSVAPPERATGFRQSSYAVVLPVDSDLIRHLQHETLVDTNDAAQEDSIDVATLNRHASAPGQMTESATQALSIPANPTRQATARNPNGNEEPSGGWFSSTSEPVLQGHGHEQATQDQFDAEMESIPSDEDVDMLRHLETGFKRIEPSFADANPFEALEDMECNFEAFQPEIPEELASGVIIIPRLVQPNSSSGDQEPLPTKRRTTDLNKCSTTSPYLDEDIVVSAEETCLESHEDRITQNVQHLSPVKALLHESKNMDQVIQSIRAMPVAWSTAFCSDLVSEGNDMKELADIHVLDRILASSGGAENDATFHQRVVASHLPLGKSRSEYVRALTDALEHQSAQVKRQWEMQRCLSAFELLVMSTFPFIYASNKWLQYLVGETDEGLPHANARLLSDGMILKLMRSRLGLGVMSKLSENLPTCEMLKAINALCNSTVAPDELPTISLEMHFSRPSTDPRN